MNLALEGLSQVAGPSRSANLKNQDVEIETSDRQVQDQDAVPCDQVSQDYWVHKGSMWTRHHVQPRVYLYVPQDEPGGPDVRPFLKDRVTEFRLESNSQNMTTAQGSVG